MQQHSVPQNITAFEFKLIGFLTLRQFGYIAGGGALAFMVFITISNFFLKWILIVIFAGGGAALAFIPINGMPFDKWIIVFTQAILSPSRRIWRKEPKLIGYFGPEFTYYLRRSIQEKPKQGSDRSKLNALIAQIKQREQYDGLDLQHRQNNVPYTTRGGGR
jgi:hypothetical protein